MVTACCALPVLFTVLAACLLGVSSEPLGSVCSGGAEVCPKVGGTFALQQQGGRTISKHESSDDDFDVYLGFHCGGNSIRIWDGVGVKKTGYGKGTRTVAECKDTCLDNEECDGFVHRPGPTKSGLADNICSFWKRGNLSKSKYERQGHDCYVVKEDEVECGDDCKSDGDYSHLTGRHCGGQSIVRWYDSETDAEVSSQYGLRSNITDLDACKLTCSEHSECSAFVWRHGGKHADNVCSWWKGPTTENLKPYKRKGHDCFVKGVDDTSDED